MRSLVLLLLAACGNKDDAPLVETGEAPTSAVDLCDALGLTPQPWHEGPYDPVLKGVADDFTVPTTAGDWNFRDRFSGCESYLFVPSEPVQARDASTPLWQRDAKELLEKLPLNTHLFFVSSANGKSGKEEDLALIEKKIEKQLGDLPADEAALRRERIHYVTRTVDKLDGWVGDYLEVPGYGFAIDRFQRIRDLGSLADGERYDPGTGWFEPNLAHVAHEAVYYEFEASRQAALDAVDATIVPAFQGEIISDEGWTGVRGYVTVELPDADTMAGFDTLTLDLSMTCDGPGELGYCPAWDRLTHLYLCAQPVPPPDPDPYEDAACQPYVPGTPGVDPLNGVCTYDGVASYHGCATVDDCPADTGATTITCDGYTTPVDEVAEIPADTLPCDCVEPDGSVTASVRTCDDDGVGYGECACTCDDEIGRWVTTYHREGRFVSDASFALPWLAEGGPQKLAYYSVDPWEVTLDLRLSDSGGARPATTRFLFGGGAFGPTYNDKYAPIDVEIPASAEKVELVYLITGHGMEMPENCAEFCDTQHHFGVNGTEHLVHFPETADPEYCQNDVANGTVPNQYGTWFYGRSNWCPGKHVEPVYVDITNDVVLGATNTFTYSADFDGAPYHSDGASISLSSWVVIR